MANQSEMAGLMQNEWRDKIIPQLGRKSNDPWIVVYRNEKDTGFIRLVWYSALVPNEHVSSFLASAEWEYYESDPVASFTGSYDADTGEDTAKYHRFGPNPLSIEPILLVRCFAKLRPKQVELIEEFRLFHNLWYDEKRSTFIKFDDGGNEKDVVKISQEVVSIRRLELRQFLAARDMSLVVYFDRRYKPGHIVEIAQSVRNQSLTTDSFRFEFKVIDGHDLVEGTPETYSWLRGKKVIPGLPREKCGIWPYDEEPTSQLEAFIIGVDENEEEIMAYSSPYSYSAASTDLDLPVGYQVPDYCTQVFFKRKVLDKYLAEPNRYKVEDGLLRCGTKWLLQIDTNNPDHVIVLLGDLGRDLPYTEHAHWKHENVAPDGRMSDSHFRALYPTTVEEALNPGEPEHSAHQFQRAYKSLANAWNTQYGWKLFKPLREADSHILNTLHIPTTNEVSKLDGEMLKLSKLLCDSINVKRIKSEIKILDSEYSAEDAEGTPKRPITILEDYLTFRAFDDCTSFIGKLRMVQDLRSTGAAHRKGTNYTRVAKTAGLDTKTTQQVADDIFTTLTDFLKSLREHFCPEDSD